MRPERFSLKGRRALITGASSGIGRAVALGLTEHGATVVLHHFGDAAGAAATAQAIGGDTAVLEADFTDTPAISVFVDNILSNHGPIDILIANAAIEQRLAWQDATPAHINAHVSANFSAFLLLAQKLVPPMAARGWGRIVATGSVMSTRPSRRDTRLCFNQGSAVDSSSGNCARSQRARCDHECRFARRD